MARRATGQVIEPHGSAVRRRDRLTGATLREFDRALEWAVMGRIEPEGHGAADQAGNVGTLETASQSRNLQTGPDSSVG